MEQPLARIASITLIDVYEHPHAISLLYEMLRERSTETDRCVNISHRQLPHWGKHVHFVQSRPYHAWYLIEAEGEVIGNVLLTKMCEIGVVLLREWRHKGFGTEAVRAIIARHPQEHFLANINPQNERSIRMFEKLGFVHVQNTYELT